MCRFFFSFSFFHLTPSHNTYKIPNLIQSRGNTTLTADQHERSSLTPLICMTWHLANGSVPIVLVRTDACETPQPFSIGVYSFTLTASDYFSNHNSDKSNNSYANILENLLKMWGEVRFILLGFLSCDFITRVWQVQVSESILSNPNSEHHWKHYAVLLLLLRGKCKLKVETIK